MTIKRIAFEANDVLSADNLNQVQDNGVIQCDTVAELSSMSSGVRLAYVEDTDTVYVKVSGSWYPMYPHLGTQSQNYTVTWTATGGTPTLGNGTLYGQYQKTGSLIYFAIRLKLGSTSSVGTTTAWTFTLPTEAAGFAVVTGHAYDNAAGRYTGTGAVAAGDTTVKIYSEGASTAWGYNAPITFATNDYIMISGVYPSV